MLRRLLYGLAALVVVLNAVAALHAWRFTHFTAGGHRLPAAARLTGPQTVKAALTGFPNPRPETDRWPALPYQTVVLHSDVRLEAWWLPAPAAKGTVALFHGYTASKSRMLDKATALHDLGYNVLLPDFRGCGGSEGVQTTIGYREAADVKACWDWLARRGDRHVFLAGTSLGAAAVLKAVQDYHLPAAGLLLECPFGTMYGTVCARFRMLHALPVPMAALLVFWGGVLNGFPAFQHNPETYAKAVTVPTLLQWGARDDRVTRAETETIYRNLRGPKVLRIYPEAGHDSYLACCRVAWTADVATFLRQH